MLSNKRIKCLEINNGNNSKKILYSRIKWFVKKMLPKKFGGFNQKIEIKFQTYQY